METFTIFLLKDHIHAAAEALDAEKDTTSHVLMEEFPLAASLFVGAQNRSTPDWLRMVNPFLETPVGNLHTANISAVLIVSYQDRFFAVTFGHGRSLLRPTTWVRDFGLKVTLNRVNPSALRSMDSKIYDDLVVTTRKQTSRSSKVGSFELDVSRALLRGVTGDAEEGGVFRRLTGAGGLRLTTELQFSRFHELLAEVMRAYEDDAYLENFPWVDNIREADPTYTAALDGLLVESLADMNTTTAYLAPGEVVDWAEIQGFNYTTGAAGVIHLELTLRDYLQITHGNGQLLTPEVLRRHHVRVRYDGNEKWRDEWSLYDCLVWETLFGGRRYVLFDGRWFGIEATFAEHVESYVADLLSATIAFPDSPDGQREGDYNIATVTASPAQYALLDCVNFLPTGATTPIEFCDILSSDRKIIHIKKRSSSATLSHLFSQGSVSADLFLQDQSLRTRVRNRLNEFQKPAHAVLITQNRPVSSDYEIVYGIIAHAGLHGWPPPLPFFSAVNLTHHAKRIRALGFQVSLQYIHQV